MKSKAMIWAEGALYVIIAAGSSASAFLASTEAFTPRNITAAAVAALVAGATALKAYFSQAFGKATIILAVLLLCLGSASAATVTLVWNANAAGEFVTKYSVYEKVGANWNKILDVTAPATTTTLLGVAPGVHEYAVTASNLWGESLRSTSALTPIPANPPSGFIIQTIVP